MLILYRVCFRAEFQHFKLCLQVRFQTRCFEVPFCILSEPDLPGLRARCASPLTIPRNRHVLLFILRAIFSIFCSRVQICQTPAFRPATLLPRSSHSFQLTSLSPEHAAACSSHSFQLTSLSPEHAPACTSHSFQLTPLSPEHAAAGCEKAPVRPEDGGVHTRRTTS
jgi:hypothetical protein